jgi:Leucine-rich repeat (LRR) protein
MKHLKNWFIFNENSLNPRNDEKLNKLEKNFLFPKNKKVELSNEYLTELPNLSNSVEYLNCSHNDIKQITKLPNNLEYLNCSYNRLNSLPELPEGLKELYCRDNNLSELPELPIGLEHLDCKNNNLPYDDLDGYLATNFLSSALTNAFKRS